MNIYCFLFMLWQIFYETKERAYDWIIVSLEFIKRCLKQTHLLINGEKKLHKRVIASTSFFVYFLVILHKKIAKGFFFLLNKFFCLLYYKQLCSISILRIFIMQECMKNIVIEKKRNTFVNPLILFLQFFSLFVIFFSTKDIFQTFTFFELLNRAKTMLNKNFFSLKFVLKYRTDDDCINFINK